MAYPQDTATRPPSVYTEPPLPLEWPEATTPEPQPEPLSADRRRTRRQRDRIALGVHPLSGAPLHELASPEICAPDAPRAQPFTCGSCRFRVLIDWHRKAYPKCLELSMRVAQDAADMETRTLDEDPNVSHGPATDVRAWWPACRKYEAGDTALSPDASRVIPGVTSR